MFDSTVVVPCYNEQDRLDPAAFLRFVENDQHTRFLFVDDGSTDRTFERLTELRDGRPERFSILRLDSNQGKAEAVRRGLLESGQSDSQFLAYWDADLATPLEAIREFRLVLAGNPELLVVMGSRVRLLGREIQRRAMRHYLGRIFATAASFVLGLPVYDTQCGAKMFRKSPRVIELWKEPFQSRWIFDVELLSRLVRQSRLSNGGMLPPTQVVYELPLLHWRDVKGSKVRPTDFLRAGWELWAIHRYLKR